MKDNDGFTKFMQEEVYNMAASTGSKAFNIDKTTISNLIEMYQGDPLDATLLLMVYIKRQEARYEIPRQIAPMLIGDIYKMYTRFRNEPSRLEQAVRKYLVLIKWIYESKISNVNNINEFIEKAKGR